MQQVRGAGLLRRLYPLEWLERRMPAALDPLARSGAIAATTFLVALVSGIVLLVWYVPSVHQAHDSLLSLGWFASFVRGLHRYSSDACILFALVHAWRLLASGRFAGARWLGWVTGVLSLGLLWSVGWTGYWLIWDTRAHLVALGTARAIDVLPIFTDPLARSFLADDRVSTLLFFVVFFFHMLVPMAMCLVIWLHVGRISRPDWLTRGRFGAWVCLSLVLVTLLVPADLDRPAQMAEPPGTVAMDAWYLAPLALTERLGGGALWALFFGVGGVLLSLPWTLTRRVASPAVVTESRCNACRRCWEDCPYEAIELLDRTDDKPLDVRASVIPSRCVGCGVCAGACDTLGIGLQWLQGLKLRNQVSSWMEEGPEEKLALLCAETMPVEAQDGRLEELPGWRVLPVSCAGWVHANLIERAVSKGATEVVIGHCARCRNREGADRIADRIAGDRAPSVRADRVVGARVRAQVVEDLSDLASPPTARRSTVAAVGIALTGLMVAGSLVPLHLGRSEEAVLAVSFEHPGAVADRCRPTTDQELAARPVHMRKPETCTRGRQDVRLEVQVDGQLAHEGEYPPGGFWGDGPSIAVVELRPGEGPHRVEVMLDDGGDGGGYRDGREVVLAPGRRSVVIFDRSGGFSWY